jgi:TetR/AcrR family transcriptional repressor of nem operon
MARPKSFEPETVLDQVAETFWAHGYAGTSITDLEEATGLGRQSLYGEFGDKHQLFLRALDRYGRRAPAGIELARQAAPTGLGAIRAYLQNMVVFVTPKGERNGCLILNTILEFGGRDAEVQQRCGRNTKTMREGFASMLEQAKVDGEVRADLDVGSAASLLTSQAYGLSVLAKDGAARAELRKAVDTLLEQLQR